MSKILDLLKGLGGNECDVFSQVVLDFQDSSAQDRIVKLTHFHQLLVGEIELINRRRDGLGVKVRNLNDFIRVLNDFERVNGADVEISLLRSFCADWRAALKREIEDSRPTGKLEKKYEVERKIELLMNMQKVVAVVGKEFDGTRVKMETPVETVEIKKDPE